MITMWILYKRHNGNSGRNQLIDDVEETDYEAVELDVPNMELDMTPLSALHMQDTQYFLESSMCMKDLISELESKEFDIGEFAN